MTYRFFFIDHADHVFGIEELDCKDDKDAVDKGVVIFRCGIGKGFQIWERDRLVHIESRK